MRNKIRMVFVVSLLGLSMFLFGCGDNKGQNEIDKIKERGVVRVGVFSDKAPFGYINNKGKFDGFDIYIAKRLAKDLLGDSNKIEFIPVDAAARVEALRSNRVDILMANFTKTEERARMVDFAKPYMKVGLGVVSKDGAIKDVKDLEGKMLIVDKGTTADFYFSKNHPEIKLLKFEQNSEAFLALKQGRASALAHDNTLLFAWSKENKGFKVGIMDLGDIEVIAPAVKKGNTDLLNWLNDEIDKLTKDGFIKEAYDATLRPIYGDEIKAETVIFN